MPAGSWSLRTSSSPAGPSLSLPRLQTQPGEGGAHPLGRRLIHKGLPPPAEVSLASSEHTGLASGPTLTDRTRTGV